MNYNLMAGTNDWMTWVLIGVLVVVMVVAMFLMNSRNKKRQKEAEDLINAVKPGNKVKTIGGVCGIVVEVNPEENTFVLETGSETSGKCYMKFDRQAILQSDAVVEKPVAAKSEKAEEPAEKPAEAEEQAEQPQEEPAQAEEQEKSDK